MPQLWRSRRWMAVGSAVAVAAGVGWYVHSRLTGVSVPEAKPLRAFVAGAPEVPVVFTSRSRPASFVAAAPESDGLTYPGTVPWAAEEGRLRLLDPDGRVYELTWGRPLPDGGTLVDVMSPSVSPDGRRVVFAGRRAPPDPGRWRLYEVGVDGRGLRQLTGGPDDAGAAYAPPLRTGPDGARLPDDDRKRLDYDDVDPIDLGDGTLVFASSRLPDLGRDHSRRATQIWMRPAGAAAPHPLSANRNNDRWPSLTTGDPLVLFSLWSRNREAVAADGSELVPVAGVPETATGPTDVWVGARVGPSGIQFGYTVKIADPVWRQRMLFNGRVGFMSADPAAPGRYRIGQATWGYLRVGPSSVSLGGRLPAQSGGELVWGPDAGPDGRPLSAGTPSPFPPDRMLFAAAPVGAAPGAYGLHVGPESGDPAGVRPLFDDPALVDAEPVAVYPRGTAKSGPWEPAPEAARQSRPARLRLVRERDYDGPAGLIENNAISQTLPDPFPGQATDTGERPVVPPPPNVKSVVVYAAHRDRFDDPERPRVPGEWEKLLVAPLDKFGTLHAWVPASPTVPTVLAGLDADGKVAKWTGTARDSAGRSGVYYAIAGDHYSGTRVNGYHFCIGCHSGHTFIKADVHERVR